ncbi:MAG TPA: F0F1 ATP synthase subunit epsilon [Vicinamibacterales bacterium]|nr:F0F1 ATP synthase subunit epsilon [Vicinamibacterales bacterium]
MSIPKHLRLEFVTPERAIAHEEVDEVGLPGEEGDFGVLPGHAPLLASLRTGTMWYRRGGERIHAFVAGGFAEVVPDRVSVLAQVAERADDIDDQRAEAAKRRAEERMRAPVSEVDFERARIALIRAMTRLDVSRHARRRRG